MLSQYKKAEYNEKKKTYRYKERDENKRQVFIKALNQYESTDLIYLDESGIGVNESYPYAWSDKGKRAFATKAGACRKRINFIAALDGRQLIAPLVFDGYCDTLLFETYLEQCLLPELSPGKIVILDNAAFHKSVRANALLHSKGCQLIFLPPYSPDLNPIEHRWFPIKNKIRQLLDQGVPLDRATELAILESSESVC